MTPQASRSLITISFFSVLQQTFSDKGETEGAVFICLVRVDNLNSELIIVLMA